MTNTREHPGDPYLRIHLGPDRDLIEQCTTDLDDDDPVAVALGMVGVETVQLRFITGDTLTYSKRVTS